MRPGTETILVAPSDSWPSICAVVPTFESAATLDAALRSLTRQRYAGEVELLVVDGGSADSTLEIARRHGARILHNPGREEETGRALGIEAATAELILLFDADDEAVGEDWLATLVGALDAAPDIVAADCLFHEWRRADPAVTRLCALMGGSDPIAVELGWADRWAWHLGRWTGMPIPEEERRGDTLLVRLDPQRPPPMGSNGFLVRRTELLRTGYAPEFVHSDCVGDLAELGFRFARVELGVVHRYAPDLATYFHKARRRARRSLGGVPRQRRGYRPPPARTLAQAVFSASVIGPAVLAARGCRRRPDRAWALYPVLSLITLWAYVQEAVRHRLRASEH
jgi:glycosyltransferase involved in cell wall biosynthesis